MGTVFHAHLLWQLLSLLIWIYLKKYTMAAVLSSSTVCMIKSLAPAIKVKGEEIFVKFFDLLYTRYPAFKNYFLEENVKSGKQTKAMASFFATFAAHPDNLHDWTLEHTSSHIVGKHVNLGVEASHYPL